MKTKIPRILIIHTWGIGDWLFFTPVLRALRVTYPDSRIDVLLGTPSTRQLVSLYPDVSVCGATDVRKGPWGMLLFALKQWNVKYDLAVFTAGVSSEKADLYSIFLRAKETVALQTSGKQPRFLSKYAHYDESMHRVDNNLKLARLLGLAMPADMSPFIVLPDEPAAAPGSVLMHPGSDRKQAFKRWPVERFVRVAEELLLKGHAVSVILGPDEIDLAMHFDELRERSGFALYKNIPFAQVLRVIAGHETFLNSDSGLGHVAGALGRRTITVFGPEDPVVARPYSAKAVTLLSQKTLPCMPCMRRSGQYGCDHVVCMENVTSEQVLASIRQGLQ